MATETGHAASRAYIAQDGTFHANGAKVTTGDVGGFTMTPAAGTTNVCNVTIAAQDYDGNALAQVTVFDLWLSDATSGAGLTATTASGGIAAGSKGTVLGVLTTSKAVRVQTDATGTFILAITDTAKTAFKVCAAGPNSSGAVVGATLATGNYG